MIFDFIFIKISCKFVKKVILQRRNNKLELHFLQTASTMFDILVLSLTRNADDLQRKSREN